MRCGDAGCHGKIPTLRQCHHWVAVRRARRHRPRPATQGRLRHRPEEDRAALDEYARVAAARCVATSHWARSGRDGGWKWVMMVEPPVGARMNGTCPDRPDEAWKVPMPARVHAVSGLRFPQFP